MSPPPALEFHGGTPNDIRFLVAQVAAGVAGLSVTFVADNAAAALHAGPLRLSSCSAISKLLLSYGSEVRFLR